MHHTVQTGKRGSLTLISVFVQALFGEHVAAGLSSQQSTHARKIARGAQISSRTSHEKETMATGFQRRRGEQAPDNVLYPELTQLVNQGHGLRLRIARVGWADVVKLFHAGNHEAAIFRQGVPAVQLALTL